MNLFADETRTLLERFVSPDWAEMLSQHIDSEAFKTIGRRVDAAKKTAIVYPEHKDLFKSLSYPFEKVKVVIVGQDPYHNGNADGLAFSCKLSLSPSLFHILHSIWQNAADELARPAFPISVRNDYCGNRNNWNLEYLAEQGVLLYNPTLTVEAGKPGSHKGIWNPFTDAVFKSLIRKENLVWMMWGRDAQEAVHKALGGTIIGQLFLTNEHPAAASYANRVWNCDHFNRCNTWLKERNQNEIEWIQR